MDVKNRLQAIRVHLLQVGEFFQVCDFQNMSFRIFNFELLGAVEDLRDSYLERSRNARLCNDAVIKLQTLFSSVSDLAVSSLKPIPSPLNLTHPFSSLPLLLSHSGAHSSGVSSRCLAEGGEDAPGESLRLQHRHQECPPLV